MGTEQEEQLKAATAVFQKDVGVWEADLEIRPAPGAEPIRQKGTTNNRTIGGGRWLIVDHRSESGFEGHGIYGWDPSTGKYTGVWVDSMLQSIARSEGTWEPATRTMTFITEAIHQGKTMRYREVIRTLEDGSQVYSNLMPTPGGGEFEMVRATYRRI